MATIGIVYWSPIVVNSFEIEAWARSACWFVFYEDAGYETACSE